MPSNHTTIGAWVNSKMSIGEKPTIILYNNINRHAVQRHQIQQYLLQKAR